MLAVACAGVRGYAREIRPPLRWLHPPDVALAPRQRIVRTETTRLSAEGSARHPLLFSHHVSKLGHVADRALHKARRTAPVVPHPESCLAGVRLTASPDATKPHSTYADYRKWAGDGPWELIGGLPYPIAPAPTVSHQSLVLGIAR